MSQSVHVSRTDGGVRALQGPDGEGIAEGQHASDTCARVMRKVRGRMCGARAKLQAGVQRPASEAGKNIYQIPPRYGRRPSQAAVAHDQLHDAVQSVNQEVAEHLRGIPSVCVVGGKQCKAAVLVKQQREVGNPSVCIAQREHTTSGQLQEVAPPD